jgi:hypothetical protein
MLLFKSLNYTCSITYKPSQFMWELVYNVTNVIFEFGSSKRKTHKFFKNNAPSQIFKTYVFGTKNWKTKKIATHMDLWKYGQVLTVQKSLIIKWLWFSNNFLIWIYHLILHHILNPNNKFGMWININYSILWWSSQTTSPYFSTSKVHFY